MGHGFLPYQEDRTEHRDRPQVVWLVIAACAAALLGIGIVAFEAALKARFSGPDHVDELPYRPAYLMEELAIEKGRATLARAGFDTNAWTLVPDARSSAPDGKPDAYFVRNTKNPNEGRFTVQDANGSRRFVHVALAGNKVTSCIVTPK